MGDGAQTIPLLEQQQQLMESHRQKMFCRSYSAPEGEGKSPVPSTAIFHLHEIQLFSCLNLAQNSGNAAFQFDKWFIQELIYQFKGYSLQTPTRNVHS